MRVISAVVGLVMLLAAAPAQKADRASPPLLKASFSKLPIYFVENRGVYPDEVKFSVQGADKTLFFTKDGITFRLKGKDKDWVVKLEFVGANPDVVPRGEDRQQAVFSYFKGPEKDWRTGLRTYSKVVYKELWPGIDLFYKGTVNQLKYEFVVAPGTDPRKIRLRYRGTDEVEITETGSVRVETPVGSLEDAPPAAWQVVDGKRMPVEATCALGQNEEYGFCVGTYDCTRPLVLDPAMIVYCGYIGGTASDTCHDLAIDVAGNVYVSGYTYGGASNFPVTVGPDPTPNGSSTDAFVAKIHADGTRLDYCGYIGGASSELSNGIAVDREGSAFVAGWTRSSEATFPVKVGPDLTHNGGTNAFIAKVNPQGTALVYCGYIGDGEARDVAVDATGRAYVGGNTFGSSALPVRVGPDLTHNGGEDAFVARVNAKGTALDYCGYIGGSALDSCWGIAVDAAGSAYVTGQASSTEASFPVKVGPDLSYNGSTDGFVAKVNPQGTALVYCGYIGGSSGEVGQRVVVDGSGNAYVAGWTQSTQSTFPVRNGPDLTHNGGDDAFIAKVDPQGAGLVYCGYVGGAANESAHAVAVDGLGNAYVSGGTRSHEKTFPVHLGPDVTYNGLGDAYVAKINAKGTALVYCGYVGGTGSDNGGNLAVDLGGNAYVGGTTGSSEVTFPVKVGPDLTHNGSSDVFVVKIALTFLEGAGAPRPAGTVNLTLTSTDDVGLPYVTGSSLGTGPISIDTRKLNLSPDALLTATVMGYWPWIFSGYRGVIDSKGQAQATIHIPNVPALIGVRLHSAFVTLDPAAPSGIRSISDTFTFSVAK